MECAAILAKQDQWLAIVPELVQVIAFRKVFQNYEFTTDEVLHLIHNRAILGQSMAR